MRDDQIKELEELTETMTDDLIQIAYAASECKFETPEERGDKVWLYKGLNQCASAISKVEQVLAYRRGDIPNISANAETQRKHEENLIKKAEQEAAKRKSLVS
ncbi:hypothetical protein [Acinetobacter gyllenbergii]|uniref:hypothetical protein n=1 Tax=Acinetobacter gyllenbergii TaxID=134534 RepID=UPI0003BFA104|nr:hypothetical protein [Acinetobacter gyllenbergii]ESK50071.1 hypothetical protein F987_01617 [Acinetobacter gyllenbergii NIPH 230]